MKQHPRVHENILEEAVYEARILYEAKICMKVLSSLQ